jgi:hypothetical protein
MEEGMAPHANATAYDALRIAFFGMMVSGAAFLSSGMAVYLARAFTATACR